MVCTFSVSCVCGGRRLISEVGLCVWGGGGEGGLVELGCVHVWEEVVVSGVSSV